MYENDYGEYLAIKKKERSYPQPVVPGGGLPIIGNEIETQTHTLHRKKKSKK